MIQDWPLKSNEIMTTRYPPKPCSKWCKVVLKWSRWLHDFIRPPCGKASTWVWWNSIQYHQICFKLLSMIPNATDGCPNFKHKQKLSKITPPKTNECPLKRYYFNIGNAFSNHWGHVSFPGNISITSNRKTKPSFFLKSCQPEEKRFVLEPQQITMFNKTLTPAFFYRDQSSISFLWVKIDTISPQISCRKCQVLSSQRGWKSSVLVGQRWPTTIPRYGMTGPLSFIPMASRNVPKAPALILARGVVGNVEA